MTGLSEFYDILVSKLGPSHIEAMLGDLITANFDLKRSMAKLEGERLGKAKEALAAYMVTCSMPVDSPELTTQYHADDCSSFEIYLRTIFLPGYKSEFDHKDAVDYISHAEKFLEENPGILEDMLDGCGQPNC